MLPYLEITHTESHYYVGLCLIKPNTLWKLFGLDIPNVMSVQVDGRKLTLGTTCWPERVNKSTHLGPPHFSFLTANMALRILKLEGSSS